jgi:hypothetical protein
MVHFLRPDVKVALHHRIIDEICAGRMLFLRLADSVRKRKIRRILSKGKLDDRAIERIVVSFADQSTACKNILLVHGLLLNRILILCLKKRWNV